MLYQLLTVIGLLWNANNTPDWHIDRQSIETPQIQVNSPIVCNDPEHFVDAIVLEKQHDTQAAKMFLMMLIRQRKCLYSNPPGPVDGPYVLVRVVQGIQGPARIYRGSIRTSIDGPLFTVYFITSIVLEQGTPI